jgi:hypothetical protein
VAPNVSLFFKMHFSSFLLLACMATVIRAANPGQFLILPDFASLKSGGLARTLVCSKEYAPRSPSLF